MSPHRPTLAWIACLAVLFNLLAMPLSSAASKGPAEQLLWGAFCSGLAGKAKIDVQALAKIDLGQHGDDHASPQHCWCCSGAASLLGLPGHAPQLRWPPAFEHGTLPRLAFHDSSPRQQWPPLNPRASPIA
ncbi:DUF2946 domain-containing protein [Pseudomonas capeferrum]|uniref:DUF2946 domain-containing protein n=1 Tax=Pseudomonas capeferrum TaxID=1495066 RepID=UPI0015E30705|nr:DUF2946 domain-containing protein [Pseudomonas capeferrum]MBA1202976.1 DUF2946 domain-containing protein [Pseudomonas capeferrum]